MNDQGLFFDWALCLKSDPPKFSFKKKIATFSMPENLLAECATADEAIAWLKQYNILFIRTWGDGSGRIATVLKGERFPGKFGRTGFRRNFPFDGEWRGCHYATKQVEAYAVKERTDWLIITVIVRYF